jgi:hypothetical protein
MRIVRTQMTASVLKFIGIYLALALAAGVMALLQLWPWQPKTAIGWGALLILALPVTVAGEWIGQRIFNKRVSDSLGASAEPGSIAWMRVAYGVAVVVVIAAAVGAIYVAVEGQVS